MGEPTGALDPAALRLWIRALDIRTATLVATGLASLVLPSLRAEQWLVLGLVVGVCVPYNVALSLWVRRHRRLHPASPALDLLLAAVVGAAVPEAWPAIVGVAVADVALAVVMFGRRAGVVATVLGAAFLAAASTRVEPAGTIGVTGFLTGATLVVATVGFVSTAERNVRARYTALVNGIAGITWEWEIDTRRVLFMSPQVESLLGWTVEEAMLESTWRARIHPDDHDLARGDCAGTVEYRVRHADGRWVHLRDMRTLGADGTVRSIAVDVTHVRAQGLALAQHADIIEAMPFSLVVWHQEDPDDPLSLTATAANPAAEPVFGRPADTLPGRRLVDLLPGADMERFTRVIAGHIAAGRGAVLEELPYERADGAGGHCTIRVIPLPDRSAALLTEDVTARREADAALRHLALHDPLTGLPNRALLRERLADALQTAERERGGVALLVLDLDQFKEINDTLGHPMGDRLLEQVGTRLSTVLRDCNTVARLGGDEFAVLVTAGGDRAGAERVAQRIAETLGEPFDLLGITVQVPASIGIALSPEHGTEAELLTQRADIAMYNAKRSGRTHAFYTCEDDRSSLRRLSLVGELRRALERDELVLHYQPQVEVATRRVVGVEALVRWEHPQHGLLPPSEFIGLAEVSGTIQPLTRWVIRRAVSHAATLARSGHPLVVAANVSARNLYDADLVEGVRRALADFSLPPELLLLELTESELVDDPSQVMTVLGRLNAMGVQIAVDDFGTGWSSLANLTQLPIDQIKVDRSFVSRMLEGGDEAVVVRSIVDLGHNLGLTVVAEGVEDEATLAALADLGCDHAQGYLLSRPVTATELATWLAARQEPATPASS